MIPPAPAKTFDELTLGHGVSLEDLIDRDALGEMVKSFYDLFGVPLRIFSEDGKLLGGRCGSDPAVHVPEFGEGRPCCIGRGGRQGEEPHARGRRHGQLPMRHRRALPSRGHPIRWQAHWSNDPGSFVPPAQVEAPAKLLALDPELDPARLRELFRAMPRADDDSVVKLARHLGRTLDLLLFSGHRALLTSNMHLASVRESFRELEDKNDKLQTAFDRLKELDRLKSNFLATVSARAAHAADFDHRLQRNVGRGPRGRDDQRAARVRADDSRQG